MKTPYQLKPKKSAFVYYRFAIRFFLSIFFYLLGYLVSNSFIKLSWVYFLILFLLQNLYTFIYLRIKYKKEIYRFYPDRIVFTTGGIFSEYKAELVIKNITNISLNLPLIENNFFNVGNVIIQSAGKVSIKLEYIDNPREVYNYLIKLMHQNRFSLEMKNPLQKETPNTLGVFFEVFKNFFGVLVFIVWVLIVFIAEGGFYFVGNFDRNLNLIIILIVIFLLGLLIKEVLTFLDLKSRKYVIYRDTITYSEGFLTKNYTIIPIENLSDSELTQTVVDRIFGLYDVKISCQGSGTEILFKNMVNGTKLEECIDKLITSKNISKQARNEVKLEYSTQLSQKRQVVDVIANNSYTANFSMNWYRTILPILGGLFLITLIIFGYLITRRFLPENLREFGAISTIFIFLIMGIFYIISGIISIIATTYNVKSASIEERYDFIKKKNKEFANNKITAIVFMENPLDWLLNTISIDFWSIGSSEDIKFRNIDKMPTLKADILAKFRIGKQSEIYRIESAFNILEWLKANMFIFSLILLSLIVLATLNNTLISISIIIFVVMVFFVVIYKYFYYKESKLYFFREYLYFTRGLFFKEDYYVLHHNIKDITTLKYPFSSFGNIAFDIGGERYIGVGRNKRLISNSFTINYVNDIGNKNELIDLIFFKRAKSHAEVSYIERNIDKLSPKPIISVKPSLKNSLAFVIPLEIIVTTILLFYFLAVNSLEILILLSFALFIDVLFLIYIVLRVRFTTYVIQPYRVFSKSGIFYKKQVSIVFNKIDNINYSQRFLNKLFNNGNVIVNTVGSSLPELVLINIPEFMKFYDVVKRKYG